jgi:serine/threonine protein kinase/tetratricopeptide (TPR) repeat protein
MDTNQRDHNPAIAAGSGKTTEDEAASSPSSPSSAVAAAVAPAAIDPGVPAGAHKTAMLAREVAFPTWVDAPLASNVRKAQVRAALFRKLEPVRVGRFILLEPLGAGAMGEIYAAYDDQLDRKVALKLVRGGSDLTAKADERLLREAQTLAQVSHPNVVQIYEAGTYNGRLFIAMELIRGKTLSSWLTDAARLRRSVRQREILRQFIAAGRGLEAAHAAGVAHRDFKPDNVLVGDDGRVRVVDFGLARALMDEPDPGESARAGRDVPEGSDGAARVSRPSSKAIAPPAAVAVAEDISRGPTITMELADILDAAARDPGSSTPKLKAALRLTETGSVMGTPSFMAPETLRGAIADRRSDQFSFCVALYHALYGAYPFSGKSLRELRDSMATDKVKFLPGVPVPAFVRDALHRGLSVEPSQRFADMTELLAALEPRTHRLRTGITAAASLVAVVVGAGLYLRSEAAPDPCAAASAGIDASWSVARQLAMHVAFLRGDLAYAELAWRGVKTRVDTYAHSWRAGATAACQATYVAHTQSAQQLDKRMLCLDRGRRQLAALVTELGTGAPDAVEHAIEATAALPDVDECSRAENLLFGVEPPPAPVAAQVATIRDQLARASTLDLMGHYKESLAIAREANTKAERSGYPPVHAEALARVAHALDEISTASARAEVQGLYFDALSIAEAERHDQLATEIWSNLTMLAVRMDSGMTQAHLWWGQAYAWSRRNATGAPRVGDDAYVEANLHYLLGEIYYRESEYAKAASEERTAISAIARAPAHQLELIHYDDALAKSLEFLDGLDEAMRLHEHALVIATETLGASHPHVIRLEINFSKALNQAGQRHRARLILEGALASIPAHDQDSHPDVARLHSLLSTLDYNEGHLDSAAEHGRASLRMYQRTQSPDHVYVAEAYMNLANVEQKRRSFTSALGLYETALAIRYRAGGDHYQTAVTEGAITETLVELERYDEAMPHLEQAERIFQRGSGRERGIRAWILTVRGELLAGKRQFSKAIPVLEQALKLYGDDPAEATNNGLAMWALSRALNEQGGNADRVRALAERARAMLAGEDVTNAHHRDMIARFLERLRARQAPLSTRTSNRPPR